MLSPQQVTLAGSQGIVSEGPGSHQGGGTEDQGHLGKDLRLGLAPWASPALCSCKAGIDPPGSKHWPGWWGQT